MIYDNVKRIADEQNIPITVLEERVGMGRGAIGKWREAMPRIDNLVNVAKALNVTVSDLLEDTDAVPQQN